MNKGQEKGSQRDEKEKDVADKEADGENTKRQRESENPGDNNGAVLRDINGGDKTRK